MKKKFLLVSGVLLCASMLATSCGGGEEPGPNPDPNPNPGPVEDINLIDSREDLFTAVSGALDDSGNFVADGVEEDFPSLYEAANYVFDNCDNGSYVKLKGDTENNILYQKRSGQAGIDGAIKDQWFYYRDGSTLDGYSEYLTGDTDFFHGEKVTRLMASSANLKYTYQPYSLIAREGHAETTAAWNILPLMDTSIRYNPKAFVGMRNEVVSIQLSDARIRPSYNETQKAVPTITLSATDSFFWSNQGIWMDTDTGNWYFVEGETQSDVKSLTYNSMEGNPVILTSTWDEEKQEWTPDGDIKMSLEYVQDPEMEVWLFDFSIEVTVDGETKTYENVYENINATGRGTPRLNISLDMVAATDDYDETTFAPDFMCGAYFKDINVTEAKGTVPEGLTDEEYQGDADMCGVPGETYSFLVKDMGEDNPSDVEIILDHYDAITYHEDITDSDVFDISYEQRASDKARTDEVAEVEKLIAQIPEDATSSDASVIKASAKYEPLETTQQRLIRYFDGYTALEDALNRG